MEDDGEVSLPPPTEDGAEKHEEGNENLVDRISELPHEVLVSVLSLLTMKEAARTSVLSRRWRKLWTHAMIDLNFEDSRTRDDILHNRISLKVGRFRFIGWVNRVLYSHQGSCLRELRVCFDLSNRCRRYVDVWISIALAKKVRNLELDFSPFLKKNSSVCYMLPGIAIPPRTGRHFDWSSLRSLCIRYVYVTGEILECILTRCPFLERLLVRGAEHLCSLKVTGSSLSLKHLDVYCKYLVYFEVSAPYLISFHYLNDTKRLQQLHIKNAPLLTDVSFGVVYEPISVYLRPVFNYLHQLETLQLYLVLYKDGLDIPKFPELTNLRNLTWVVHTSDTGSLLQLTSLIEAAPFLHTFTLGLSWTEPWVWRRRIAKKQDVTSNEYLKMVKIVGFRGHAVDFELILYLLEKATMLEEIVIDLRDFVTGAFPTEEEQAVRNRAGLLKQWLPHAAKLIVL